MISFVWKKVASRKLWASIFRSLFLMALGAYLITLYLAAQMPQAQELLPIRDSVKTAALLFLAAWSFTTPSRQPKGVAEPSPALSGTVVVLACGFAAAFFLAEDASWPRGFVGPSLIVLATLAIAAIVYRFASKHAQDIGEARFHPPANSGGPTN